MSRNTSGTFTIPSAAFVPGTAIVATPVNANMTDIATALSDSLSTSGSAPMTGSIKAADGSASEGSYIFESSKGVGFYLNLAESGVAWLIASVSIALFTSVAATTSLATYWHGNQRFNGLVAFRGGVVFSGGINTTTSISGGLTVTKGLRVGFTGAPDDDKIAIGDNVFSIAVSVSNDEVLFTYDTNDRVIYSRVSNHWTYNIASTVVERIATTTVFFAQPMYIPEISAPTSASANSARVYAKDNGLGTTRVYYKDSAGVEIPMGGAGSWEEITSFTVTASVASIVFSLSKLYSRIVVCGVSMSATADSTRSLIVEVSDDAGGSYEAALRGGWGGNSGSTTGDVSGTTSAPMRDTSLTAAADLAFYIEFMMTDQAAKAKPFSGQAASFGDARGFFGAGQTTACDDIDAIRVRWSTGALIDAGTLTLYGELAA